VYTYLLKIMFLGLGWIGAHLCPWGALSLGSG